MAANGEVDGRSGPLSLAARLSGWPRQVILSGCPRSGTTLLYTMLRGVVRGAHCPDSERTALRYLASPRPLVVTKRPLDVMRAGEILARNRLRKPLHFVFVLRDPRNLVSSMHESVPGVFFQGFDYSHFVTDKGWSSLSNDGVVAWARGFRAACAIPGLRCSTVRYEDLVADPDAVQTRLAGELGIAMRGRFSDFHLKSVPDRLAPALNSLRPADAAGIEAWRKPERLGRVLHQFGLCPELFRVMEDWGYGDDRGWFDAAAKMPPAPPVTVVRVPSGSGGWRTLATERRRVRGPILALGPGFAARADSSSYLGIYRGDLAFYVTRNGAWSTAALRIADSPAAHAVLEMMAASGGALDPRGDDAGLRAAAARAEARVEHLPPTFAWGLETMDEAPVPCAWVETEIMPPA